MSLLRSKPAAVLDANAIIGLAKSGCLSLVPRVFAAVFTPPLVVSEVTDPLSRAELVPALGDWLVEETPTAHSLQQSPPHRGEADQHVLALAIDHQPCMVVTGDRALISMATEIGIETTSAPRIIQLLAEARLVPQARPCLDQMQDLGFGIAADLYTEILSDLGE